MHCQSYAHVVICPVVEQYRGGQGTGLTPRAGRREDGSVPHSSASPQVLPSRWGLGCCPVVVLSFRLKDFAQDVPGIEAVGWWSMTHNEVLSS